MWFFIQKFFIGPHPGMGMPPQGPPGMPPMGYGVSKIRIRMTLCINCVIFLQHFAGPPPPGGPGGPPGGPPPGQENLNALQRAIDSMEEKGLQEDPR